MRSKFVKYSLQGFPFSSTVCKYCFTIIFMKQSFEILLIICNYHKEIMISPLDR